MLNEYLQQAQRFIRDERQQYVDEGNLVSYINRGRREIAMRAQAIRILTPITGSIISATVVSGGSGYTDPKVEITAPDFPSGTTPFPIGDQATGTATQNNGIIEEVNISYGGHGYFQPEITITDPTGSGASVSAVMSYINQLSQGQEVYPFSMVDLSPFPGVESIYYVRRNSIIFSNWRYSCRVYSFTVYNAQIRTFPFQFQYAPFFAAQFGRGTAGQYYLYPQPSQAYQLEWDCQCLPMDLTDDESPEALPDPFTDGVAYFAAYMAFQELQNYNVAKWYKGEFDEFIRRYQKYTQPGTGIDAYNGRW